jgi:hypothetical protein
MKTQLCKRTQMHYFAAAMLPGADSGAPGSPDAAVGGERPSFRFPPTRAAQDLRSRGVFLEDPCYAGKIEPSRWMEAVGAVGAVIVAALALAVCINSSSMAGRTTFNANPGPGIVASASVAPTFVVPVQSR